MTLPALRVPTRTRFVIAVAAVLTLVNAAVLAERAGRAAEAGGPALALWAGAIDLLWLFAVNVALLVPAMVSARLLKLWSFLLLVAGAGAAWAVAQYGISFTREMGYAIVGTNPGEIRELLRPWTLALAVCAFGPPALLLARLRLPRLTFAPHGRALAGAGLVVLLFGGAFLADQGRVRATIREATEVFAPVGLVSAVVDVARREWLARNVAKADIAQTFVLPGPREDAPTVVLVVGESTRAQNFGLGGYARQTTPRLAVRDGVVYFPEATACSTTTAVAVPCMLSRLEGHEFALPPRETSLVGVFAALGYDAHWYSVQRGNNRAILSACAEAPTCRVNLPGHDEVLIPPLEAALAAPGPAPRFVLLHTLGAHANFHERYPAAFARFRPECRDVPYACDRQAAINAYDNAILYVDHVLDEVIARLEGRDAVLIYASDHGESIGEGFRYGHAAALALAPEEQTRIPFLVWTSRIFREKRPDFAARIAARRGQRVSHDHIFHTALGCAGARSALIRPSLDLCADSPAGALAGR
ncbi:phosphoethanolamine transferase [Prosthecomicrobium sp. N25]|uniref:phosphoethanolamine transferase n=1 Tax=Prosthecomicrobium sp. N25 TaxID=3129254 RepID=UPI0030785731